MSRRLLALTLCLVVVPSVAAAAPSRAWTAAKKVHAEAPIIAGVDVASAKASESFKKFWPMLLDKKPEVKEVLDKLQTTCSFDPFTAVQSAVAVVDDGANNKGAFYIALKGWDATKLAGCMKKVATGEKKELTVGAIKKGIQELEMKGRDEKLYLGWIGKDVLVVATDPTDKSLVEKMVGGKGTGQANKLANKLDTGATVWMVVLKQQPIQGSIEMKALYGTAKIAKGNVAGDMRIITGDAKQATDLVTMVNSQLPAAQSGGMLPPGAAAIVKSLKIKSAGAEVQATASAPEADLLSLLSLVMAM
jgi:hypothetical protein